jgi:hypothetical protein
MTSDPDGSLLWTRAKIGTHAETTAAGGGKPEDERAVQVADLDPALCWRFLGQDRLGQSLPLLCHAKA